MKNYVDIVKKRLLNLSRPISPLDRTLRLASVNCRQLSQVKNSLAIIILSKVKSEASDLSKLAYSSADA